MPRNLLSVRLTESEAQAARQAFGNAIDFMFLPSSCPRCFELGAGGCSVHRQLITDLRNLRRRFSFSE